MPLKLLVNFRILEKGCDHRVTLGAEKAENRDLFYIFLLNLTLKIMMLGAEFSLQAEKSHPWIQENYQQILDHEEVIKIRMIYY